MSDLSSFRTGPGGPAVHVFAITPNDVTALPVIPKAFRANTAGTVTFRAIDSGADVTMDVLAGETVAVITSHIRATGTTATLHGFA